MGLFDDFFFAVLGLGLALVIVALVAVLLACVVAGLASRGDE